MIPLEKRRVRESFRHHHYADVQQVRRSWEPKRTSELVSECRGCMGGCERCEPLSYLDREIIAAGRFEDRLFAFALVAVFIIIGLWWSVTSVL